MDITKLCEECKKEFITNRTKTKYCSYYCRDKNRRRRYKDTIRRLQKAWIEKNREKRNAWYREWEKKNYPRRKEKNKRWMAKHPHYQRDYHYRPKAIEKEKRYRQTERYKKLNRERQKRYRENNKDKIKERIKLNPKKYRKYYRKYSNSIKGKARRIKRRDKQKMNTLKLLGTKNNNLSKILKNVINRDKVCIYCGSEFNNINQINYKYPTFDHLNPNLPLIENNTVLCCRTCNASKGDKNVLEWLKSKNYPVNPIILNLLSKQKGLVN